MDNPNTERHQRTESMRLNPFKRSGLSASVFRSEWFGRPAIKVIAYVDIRRLQVSLGGTQLLTGTEFDGKPHELDVIRTESRHFFLSKDNQSPKDDDLVIVRDGKKTLRIVRWQDVRPLPDES